MVFLERLIKEIKNRPCLWNKKMEDYRNHYLRDGAWDSIAQEFDRPVKDLKGEWKKLQDSYRQAMFRRKTKYRQGARAMRPWRYEKEMSFLHIDFPLEENPLSIGLPQGNEECQNLLEFIKEEEEILSDLSETDCTTPKTPKESYLSQRIDDNEHQDALSKRRKVESGELDYFFKSICESTKRLPRSFQLKIKAEVMKIILDAELEHLNAE